MKDVLAYQKRLKLPGKPSKDIDYLSALHKAHFFSVPFENFSMKGSTEGALTRDSIANKIIFNNRGGICFEFSVLLKEFFEHFGFTFRMRLARVLVPLITPATHQLFIVTLDDGQWIFDIGFGAKGPRAPLSLTDGYLHEHPFLSSRVSKDPEHGWIVSVKENSKPDAVWEDIYSFNDTAIFPPDINMAYFYTLFSPESLLNINRVASIPTENGRLSIRNTTFTEVKGLITSSVEITDRTAMAQLLYTKFGISLSPENFPDARS